MHLLIDDRSSEVHLADTDLELLELSRKDAIRLATAILKNEDEAEATPENQPFALI